MESVPAVGVNAVDAAEAAASGNGVPSLPAGEEVREEPPVAPVAVPLVVPVITFKDIEKMSPDKVLSEKFSLPTVFEKV